ncbi:Hypothetical predicted protein [Olea europaea subsp. europaea]|uniref:Uncharacterized protein n=1 Tax=Olea europaea subsp. europaea TaxID=158383 RepID=A0A8S0VI07_OLEEU|nr:Hypothetical predicted protein [Olea europaea subsp. europaea]
MLAAIDNHRAIYGEGLAGKNAWCSTRSYTDLLIKEFAGLATGKCLSGCRSSPD